MLDDLSIFCFFIFSNLFDPVIDICLDFLSILSYFEIDFCSNLKRFLLKIFQRFLPEIFRRFLLEFLVYAGKAFRALDGFDEFVPKLLVRLVGRQIQPR